MIPRRRDGRSAEILQRVQSPRLSEAARVGDGGSSTLTALRDDTADRFVSRAEAARFLGVSESTVRRLEHTELPPVVENGVHRHSLRKLREFGLQRASRGTKQPDSGFGGGIAGDAFGLFDEGRGPAEVVRSLRVEPHVARELFREWADLRGALAIGGVTLSKIERLADMFDGEPVSGQEALLRVLDGIWNESSTCLCCSRATPKFCARCCIQRYPGVARRAQHALSSAEARAEQLREKLVGAATTERARRRSADSET